MARPDQRRRKLWGTARVALSLVVVVVVFVGVLPRVADFSEVWATIRAMTWLELATLVMAAAWNIITYWILLVATVPRLTWTQAMIVTESSTALASTVPGGAALGLGLAYSMYASWGFRRADIALALIVSGLGDLFAKLAMPVLALAALSRQGDTDPALVSASILGAALLAVALACFAGVLSSDLSARRIGAVLGSIASRTLGWLSRPPVRDWGERLVRFRAETGSALRRRWPLILSASLLSHFSLFLVLLLALRHVGVSEQEVGWAEALGTFSVVRLLTALPITPGGLGIVELGLSAGLVVAGGPRALVVAAVLLFRALTYLVQIPFGAITYLAWSHGAGGRETGGDRAGRRETPESPTESLG